MKDNESKPRGKRCREDDPLSNAGFLAALKWFVCQLCPKPKPSVLTIMLGPDERIKKGPMTPIVLNLPPLNAGFRRPFTITADEAVENARVEILAGDSTATVQQDSPKVLSGFLNGDGSTGVKEVDVVVDGHIGDGEVELRLKLNFNVQSPDATDLGFVAQPDEKIPA